MASEDEATTPPPAADLLQVEHREADILDTTDDEDQEDEDDLSEDPHPNVLACCLGPWRRNAYLVSHRFRPRRYSSSDTADAVASGKLDYNPLWMTLHFKYFYNEMMIALIESLNN